MTNGLATPKTPKVTKRAIKNAMTAAFMGQTTREHEAILDAKYENPGSIYGLSKNDYSKLLKAKEIIHNTDEHQKLLFIAREMILCHLPVQPLKNEDGTPKTHYTRTVKTPQGLLTLTLSTKEEGNLLPFGTDRRVLTWMQTKAKQAKNALIEWKYASEFFKFFDLSDTGTDYKRLQKAWDRIINCSFHLSFKTGSEKTTESVPFIKKSFLPTFMDKRLEDQGESSLSGYYVELTSDFYDLLLESAVPIRLEVLKEFQNEPKAWDFVIFVCWRSYLCQCSQEAKMNSTAYISWNDLKDMFGTTDQNPRQLRTSYRKILDKLKVIWPECQVNLLRGGVLEVKPPMDSLHPVREKEPSVLAEITAS